MSTPDVETHVAAYLIAQTGSLTQTLTSANCFAGPERGIDVTPSLCVFVQTYGGGFDHDNDGAVRRIAFQVTTRAGVDAYATGEALARSISDLLSLKDNVTLSGTRYLAIRAVSAGPTPIGQDGASCELFVQSFEAIHGD